MGRTAEIRGPQREGKVAQERRSVQVLKAVRDLIWPTARRTSGAPDILCHVPKAR
jgi:hypothetical protein